VSSGKRSVESDADVSDTDISDANIERVAGWFERLGQLTAKRDTEPYDGVLGVLPEWVPQWHQDQFRKVRNELLDRQWPDGFRPSGADVRRWIDAYAALGDSQNEAYIPEEVCEKVGYLAHLRWAVSLGEEQGLSVLAGPPIARARFRQRDIAQKPRRSPIHKDVEAFLRSNPSATWKHAQRHIEKSLGKADAEKVTKDMVSRIRRNSVSN
jgi:hypothetical protein